MAFMACRIAPIIILRHRFRQRRVRLLGSDSATKRANRFKCRGSLEMAALLGGGEIRDERFRPKRGKNPGIWGHHGSRLMPGGGLEFWRPYSWKGRGADHGDRANGMKSW